MADNTQSVPVEQIEQCDRDAAADCRIAYSGMNGTAARLYRQGKLDTDVLVQAFARHRLAALAHGKSEPVAWMYEIPDANVRQVYVTRRIWNDGWTETPLYATPQDPAAVERAAEPDLLAEFGKHWGWELSFQGWDEDACWQVHNVTGGRNDREWALIGEGETPQDAIRAAIEAGAHGGSAD